MGWLWASLTGAGYGLAAIAAAALAFWLFARRSARGPAAPALVAALAFTSAWAASAIALGWAGPAASALLVCSNLAWLWSLYRLFADDERDKSVGPVRPVVMALAFAELMQFALVGLQVQLGGQVDTIWAVLRFGVILRLLFCVGVLVLVHNLYAGAAQPMRRALRWPAAALAAMWLYDLNLYTVAYLSGALPAVLGDLRGAAMLAVVGLLALGTARQDGAPQFQPSRSFAFQSFSLLVIGGYLLVMVLVAQGLAYVGTDVARAVQIGFVVLASALAVALLPSRRLRGWLRVTLSKHLFQHRYDYRAEWLRFTETIGRAGPTAPPLHERAVQAVADITDSPRGLLLTPREEGGLTLDARWQWPDIKVPAEAMAQPAIQFFTRNQFILDLDDMRGTQIADVPEEARPDWLAAHPEAWALVPLIHYERLVGMVVLARPAVARRLDWEDFDLLRVVGRQLASYLAEQSSQDALGEAQRFDEFNRRIAFVMHDIKNLASQLSLLAANAEKHADKPEFRADMILTLRNSTDKLQALLKRLGRYGASGSEERCAVALQDVMGRLLARYRHDDSVIALERPAITVIANADALEQALVHLVQNAIDASEPGKPVYVDTRVDRHEAVVEIVDSGPGMSPEFIRTRLFRPFHSSKPGGFGIGAFEARELIRAMGGRLDVESREGMGTRFQVRLPQVAASGLVESMNRNRTKVA